MKAAASGFSAAVELLRQAEAFADASVRGVLERLPEDPRRPNRLFRDYARLLLELEVHFLFPNLSTGDRRVLVELLRVRDGLAFRRAAGRGGKRVGASASQEKRWRELSERVRRLSRSLPLTAAQKEVLEAAFLESAASN